MLGAWLGLPLLHFITTTLAVWTVENAGNRDAVAGYIHEGLHTKDGNPRETTADARPTPTNISTSESIRPIVTGSGSDFASSCQAALWSWKEASETFGSQHAINTSTTVQGSLYATYTYTDFTGGVKASRTTTLCDGYPRVIGSGSYEDIQTSTISFSAYPISTSVPGTYPTRMPCSIGASDCSALWKSFASFTSASLVFENRTALEPPCQTETANTSVPFETAACIDKYGPGPGIVGSQVRLLYWPVRTAESPAAHSYFCSSYVSNNVTPTYLPGTRTGVGPNTFVTGDLTITSPTVAISFSGLHRQDGCGTTVDHTILTLDPSLLSSVRGARAAYGWYPFNLADLNWRCESPSGVFTLQDTNETANGAECYQDVAAQAYWGAAPQVDYARGAANTFYSSLTIVNNYRPYVIPDQRVGTELLRSLWGSTATWWIDGIWDPPLALTQASQEATPTPPGVGKAAATTTAGSDEVLTTPAMPAETMMTKVSSTARKSLSPTPTAVADLEPSSSTSSSSDVQPSHNSMPNSRSVGSATSDDAGAIWRSESSTSQAPAGSNVVATAVWKNTASGASLIDQPAVMIPGQSMEVSWRSHTLTIGGAAWTQHDQVATAARDGLVLKPVSASTQTTVPYFPLTSLDTVEQTTAVAAQPGKVDTSDVANGDSVGPTSASAPASQVSSSGLRPQTTDIAPASGSAATKPSVFAFPVTCAILLVVALLCTR